jgi:hypothetical protein
MVAISNDWTHFAEMTQNMLSSSLGIVDSERLLATLQKGRRGEEVPTIALMRTIFIEGWLRSLRTSGIVNLKTTREAELAWQASAPG